MNIQNIMITVFGAYLGIGLFLVYRSTTKEVPEIFDEELDKEEDRGAGSSKK
ncbi:hypothetical protein [Paenibacillus sp. P36]|uniref:hypothetical protein n=1 Tax=Paenibacillus sp. P36 TaxID=3342538 RepID=UPI0038B27F19